MPLTVTYEILDTADGRFGVVVTMAPGRTYRRGGLATLAEAEDWVEGLRMLMAACGAPVVRSTVVPTDRAPTAVAGICGGAAPPLVLRVIRRGPAATP